MRTLISFAGLALSTLAVSLAAAWATHARLGTGGRTIAAEAANVAAFGSLWVVQFVVLDRLLFRSGRLPAGSREGRPDGDLDRDRVLEAA